MRQFFRKVFAFVLNPFEKGDEPYVYKSMNRKILIAVGVLFNLLTLAIALVGFAKSDLNYLIPLVVFFSVGFVCLVVGILGTERAVSSIWGKH